MLRAVIFDFNGVLVDDEHIHLQAFRQVLGEEGISLTEADYYAHYLGMDDRGCFKTTHRAAGRFLDDGKLLQLIERKAVHYRTLIESGVIIFSGVTKLLQVLAPRFPLAIASGALRHEIEAILEQSGLRDFFRVIVSAEDVLEGKPDPQIFLRALEFLNQQGETAILATQCLVIEDSKEGISAAKGARMKCLAVTNSYAAAELVAADAVVARLDEVDVTFLTKLF
jgi:beta-phosphoglucomutase-like phosphatase (HAD superfamily)